jgi:hypothetical protein
VQELKDKGLVYPCFCTDEELEGMKRAAEAANLPPIYNGKWARAGEDAVKEEMAKGTPFCYRFRVPPNKNVVVRDLVRGDVTFNTDTLGDFVVMRSNGLPVRPGHSHMHADAQPSLHGAGMHRACVDCGMHACDAQARGTHADVHLRSCVDCGAHVAPMFVWCAVAPQLHCRHNYSCLWCECGACCAGVQLLCCGG